ncbi:hypothetical protein E4T56_gene7028 [Termitomyces sp. T112]|nr:hypothetical protein E4T56_gene7028 [Termitomyces sp. T112]
MPALTPAIPAACPLPPEIPMDVDAARQFCAAPLLCWRCQKPGHFAQQCPLGLEVHYLSIVEQEKPLLQLLVVKDATGALLLDEPILELTLEEFSMCASLPELERDFEFLCLSIENETAFSDALHSETEEPQCSSSDVQTLTPEPLLSSLTPLKVHWRSPAWACRMPQHYDYEPPTLVTNPRPCYTLSSEPHQLLLIPHQNSGSTPVIRIASASSAPAIPTHGLMPELHQAPPPFLQLVLYSSGPPQTCSNQFPLAILTSPQCLGYPRVPGFTSIQWLYPWTPSYSSHTPPPSPPAPPSHRGQLRHHQSFTQNPGNNSTQCSTTSLMPHPHPSNNNSKSPAMGSCSPHERPIANLTKTTTRLPRMCSSEPAFGPSNPQQPVCHQEQTQWVPNNIESAHNLNSRTPPPNHSTSTPIPEKVHPPKLAPPPTGIKPNPAIPLTMTQGSEIDATPQLQNTLLGSVRTPQST